MPAWPKYVDITLGIALVLVIGFLVWILFLRERLDDKRRQNETAEALINPGRPDSRLASHQHPSPNSEVRLNGETRRQLSSIGRDLNYVKDTVSGMRDLRGSLEGLLADLKREKTENQNQLAANTKKGKELEDRDAQFRRDQEEFRNKEEKFRRDEEAVKMRGEAQEAEEERLTALDEQTSSRLAAAEEHESKLAEEESQLKHLKNEIWPTALLGPELDRFRENAQRYAKDDETVSKMFFGHLLILRASLISPADEEREYMRDALREVSRFLLIIIETYTSSKDEAQKEQQAVFEGFNSLMADSAEAQYSFRSPAEGSPVSATWMSFRQGGASVSRVKTWAVLNARGVAVHPAEVEA